MTFGFDLDLLRTFTAVVETGGFTRAAYRVHLTQSTISQQIKKLEASLGHALLIRDRAMGSVRTTEEGELLMSYARRILSVSAEANEALGRSIPLPKTVRLGVPEDFAGRRMIDLLSGFARASPRTRLDTISGWSFELRRLFQAGEIDLALVKREPGDGACIAKWEERLVWIGDPLLAVGKDPVPLAVFPSGCIYRERVIRRWNAAAKPGVSPIPVRASWGYRPLSPPALASAYCPTMRCCPSIGCCIGQMVFCRSPHRNSRS